MWEVIKQLCNTVVRSRTFSSLHFFIFQCLIIWKTRLWSKELQTGLGDLSLFSSLFFGFIFKCKWIAAFLYFPRLIARADFSAWKRIQRSSRTKFTNYLNVLYFPRLIARADFSAWKRIQRSSRTKFTNYLNVSNVTTKIFFFVDFLTPSLAKVLSWSWK